MISSAVNSGGRRRICRSLIKSQRTSRPAASVTALVKEGNERGLEVVGRRRARAGGRLGRDRLVELAHRPVEEALAVGEHEQSLPVALRLLDVVGGEDHGGAAPCQ